MRIHVPDCARIKSTFWPLSLGVNGPKPFTRLHFPEKTAGRMVLIVEDTSDFSAHPPLVQVSRRRHVRADNGRSDLHNSLKSGFIRNGGTAIIKQWRKAPVRPQSLIGKSASVSQHPVRSSSDDKGRTAATGPSTGSDRRGPPGQVTGDVDPEKLRIVFNNSTSELLITRGRIGVSSFRKSPLS